MILTTSDPVCTARDPASLEAEWSELARRRARPSIFLTPEWLAVARTHDPREQLTLAIGSRGIAAIARDSDGTVTFAGGDLTDEQDVVAAPPDARFVAEALGAWIGDQAIGRAAFSYVPEETPTPEALARAFTARGFAVRTARQVTSPRVSLPADFETYLESLTKKERHELRRKIRRLETGRRGAFRVAGGPARAAGPDRVGGLPPRLPRAEAGVMTKTAGRFFPHTPHA